jgi:tellurite resistance protein TehA-like permease
MAPNMAKKSLETETSKESEANKSHDATARAGVRERLKQFTWAWFSMTMSTGALAAVLYNTPNRFSGLLTIGKIFLIIDIVFFCLFVSAITARFVLEPSALPRSLHHPTESLFFGTFWVSIALILQNAQFYGHQYAGAWLVTALRVCFWLYVGLIFLVGIFQYHTLFIKERLQVPSMMPAWILPIYPFLVAGPLAGVLLESQPESHAISMLIGGVMFQGLGWMVSVFMYTIFIIRLMSSDLPPPSMRAGMYISVGPACKLDAPTTTLLLKQVTDTFHSIHFSSPYHPRIPSSEGPPARLLRNHICPRRRFAEGTRCVFGHLHLASGLLVLHAI